MGIPLSTINGSLDVKQSLTYAIYWSPKNAPDALTNGHATVIIDSVKFWECICNTSENTDWYVSWSGGQWTMKGHLGATSGFLEDGATWGGKAVSKLNILHPTRWVALQGLDIAGMKAEWDQIRKKQNAHWKMLDKNCATVAARVLKAGGGDRYATKAKKQLVWWPTDVIRYAKSMTGKVHSTS